METLIIVGCRVNSLLLASLLTAGAGSERLVVITTEPLEIREILGKIELPKKFLEIKNLREVTEPSLLWALDSIGNSVVAGPTPTVSFTPLMKSRPIKDTGWG